MSIAPLVRLAACRSEGHPEGITSVCSAHPLVIEAALLQAAEDETPVLIEATCNQVNQEGGYTGMTPAGFRAFVEAIADRLEFPRTRIILGGDHLGPNPWRNLPAEEAVGRAETMIAAYAAAGYEKLHLDCSMGCAGEPGALDDATTAMRAARLARRAEAASEVEAVYVIGTEVPTPGGATESLDHLEPTRPEAVRATYDVHEKAFRDIAGGRAWQRVIAMVVQPGVEFGHEDVVVYAPDRAQALSDTLASLPGLVFEAHSTDYQPEAALAALVRDGFPILKVGPGLTFALREALYGLDAIAGILHPDGDSLVDALEAAMLAEPAHWRSHYPGTSLQQRVLRHFSYSDRVRYYWPHPGVRNFVDALFAKLSGVSISPTLVSQYLPRLHERVSAGVIQPDARDLVIASVRDVLRSYARACRH